MAAKSYFKARHAMARTIRLGSKPGQKANAEADPAAAKPKRGGKPALAAAKEALGTAE